MDTYYTVDEAAARLHWHRNTVLKWITSGRLHAVKVGKSYRIPSRVLQRLLGGEPVERAHIIAIANQKGGVGKTTTAVNLAVALAQLTKRVLLIDLDPQGACAISLGLPLVQEDGQILPAQQTVYGPLLLQAPWDGVIRTTPYGVDFAPATLDLAGAEVDLQRVLSREYVLQRALEPLRARYDYILLDTPPTFGLLPVNALTAARSVLVPVACDYLALRGLALLLTTLASIKQATNPDLQMLGILPTLYDGRTGLHKRTVEQLTAYAQREGLPIFLPPVPRTIRAAEAAEAGAPIFVTSPGTDVALRYVELAKEIVDGDTPTAATSRRGDACVAPPAGRHRVHPAQ